MFSLVATTTKPIHNSRTDAGLDHADESEPDQKLVDMLRDLFVRSRYVVFHDGMTSDFSRELHRIVQKYGVPSIVALEKVLRGASVGVAEEALMQIGYIEDKKTHNRRLALLERALESPDTRIRDAASVGIATMEDPAAIESLQRALDNEPYELLQKNIKDVLVHLQDIR